MKATDRLRRTGAAAAPAITTKPAPAVTGQPHIVPVTLGTLPAS